jgi:hypothetical protein
MALRAIRTSAFPPLGVGPPCRQEKWRTANGLGRGGAAASDLFPAVRRARLGLSSLPSVRAVGASLVNRSQEHERLCVRRWLTSAGSGSRLRDSERVSAKRRRSVGTKRACARVGLTRDEPPCCSKGRAADCEAGRSGFWSALVSCRGFRLAVNGEYLARAGDVAGCCLRGRRHDAQTRAAVVQADAEDRRRAGAQRHLLQRPNPRRSPVGRRSARGSCGRHRNQTRASAAAPTRRGVEVAAYR